MTSISAMIIDELDKGGTGSRNGGESPYILLFIVMEFLVSN
mgnify:CR=1 FL=1